ncbi:putative solute carrier family 22 member 31 [Neopsephotus bourkii]|uniref:putative solute carrier family 22 member 31 n=1 Tax=Neopsephotus bourkii TaxID=309878 RepID=UPI002AA54DE3|nr:putative solute carrier family 22 member 31 [Neopsephotus bourkii]
MGSGYAQAERLTEAWREEAKDTICMLQKLLSSASNHMIHELVNTMISSSLFSTGGGSLLGEAEAGNHGGRAEPRGRGCVGPTWAGLGPGGAVPAVFGWPRCRPHLPVEPEPDPNLSLSVAESDAVGGCRPRGRRGARGWTPCLALGRGWAGLGWALGTGHRAPGTDPQHHCRPDAALLAPLRRLAGASLLCASVPGLCGGRNPCQLYWYRVTGRPNGTGPCACGWHYSLPATGLLPGLSGPALLLESPHCLLATQQLERARETLKVLAKGNGSSSDNSSCHRKSSTWVCGGGMVTLLTWVPLSMQSWKPCLKGSPQAWYHAPCEIFGTRVIWKKSVILGFTMFISSGICHCFTCSLAPHLLHFFSCYLVLVDTKATACLFLTAERFGHNAILLLCTLLTGISSLLLLALTQCEDRLGIPALLAGIRNTMLGVVLFRIQPLMVLFPLTQTLGVRLGTWHAFVTGH